MSFAVQVWPDNVKWLLEREIVQNNWQTSSLQQQEHQRCHYSWGVQMCCQIMSKCQGLWEVQMWISIMCKMEAHRWDSITYARGLLWWGSGTFTFYIDWVYTAPVLQMCCNHTVHVLQMYCALQNMYCTFPIIIQHMCCILV